jgi:lipoic acid synthetase
MNRDPRRLPPWLTAKVPADAGKKVSAMRTLLLKGRLNSVCQSARCPNIAHCFSKGTVTFMILGNICTRNCMFCAVSSGTPDDPDPDEPYHIAEAVRALNLSHVVVTSVTRDDLYDGGASNFSQVVKAIRSSNPKTTVELLIPDFCGSMHALKTVADSNPDIIGHNIETVPRLFKDIRSAASFERSLIVVKQIKELDHSLVIKSGFMVGLGETQQEVLETLSMLRDVHCDIVTIGQYLRPSSEQVPIVEYIHPERFAFYQAEAEKLRFKAVLAGPLVRSSFDASALFGDLKVSSKHDTAHCRVSEAVKSKANFWKFTSKCHEVKRLEFMTRVSR